MHSVLVVDDDRDSREAVVRFFSKAGYLARAAENGSDALVKVGTLIPDVVILDMQMPEMDGVGFIQIIRNYIRWSTLPVILLTAYAEGPEVVRARDLGVKHVFSKGNYRLAELERCVQNIILTLPYSAGASG